MFPVLLLAFAAAAPVQKDMAAIENAFDDTEFEEAISRANRLLKSDARLDKTQKKRLHEIAAFSYFYLGRKGPAEAQLRELFDLDEQAGIDRKKATPELAAFFDEVKLRWGEARQKVVKVAPDQPNPEQPRPVEPKNEPSTGDPPRAATEEPRPPFRAVALIPFGIGQLALGDYAVGAVLLVIDAALAATSIALYWVRQSEKINGSTQYNDPDRAKAMQIAQNVAAFTLVGVGIIGFIDALTLAPYRVQAKQQKTSLHPLVAPAEGGATFGILGRF